MLLTTPISTCGVSRFRAGIVIREGQLRLVVLYVGVVVMEVVRHSILHRRMPAAHPRQGIPRRQRPPLSTSVGGAEDAGQGALGAHGAQIQGRSSGELVMRSSDLFELGDLGGVVVGIDGGGVGLGDGGAVFDGEGHGLRVVRCVVLVAAGTAPPVGDGGGAPVAPGHGGVVGLVWGEIYFWNYYFFFWFVLWFIVVVRACLTFCFMGSVLGFAFFGGRYL